MTRAYVLMGCELGKEQEAISKLKSIENVKHVYGTLGTYDLLAKVEADTEEHLSKTITEKIRSIDFIHSAVTLTIVKNNDKFKPKSQSTDFTSDKSTAQAYIVLHTDKGKEFDVIKGFEDIPQIKEADVVFGHYDVIGKIEVPTHKELEDVITREVRKIHNILACMTLIVIQEQG
jgi:DNA-binding Lrp family transcriptional regulator